VRSGSLAPEHVAVAKLHRGQLEVGDEAIRGWLASGLAMILGQRAAPTSDADDARIAEELCALRSGSAYVLSLDPDAFEGGAGR
jgi:hypothetical protein